MSPPLAQENKLTTIATPQLNGVHYDPLGRFRGVSNATTTVAFDRVGTDLVASRLNGGATTERYVFAPGMDEPMVGYDSAGTRLFFHADERGSIVARSDSAGSAAGRTYAYDDYGRPSGYSSRFLYAGKMHLAGVNAYYNNARFYDYALGRFLQPDPIGYGGGMNLYAYVRGDPVNATDPLGACTVLSTNIYDVYNGRTGEWLGQEYGPWVSKLGPDCEGGVPTPTLQPLAFGGGGGGTTRQENRQARCNVQVRVRANAAASRAGIVTFDTPSELALLTQYFSGDATPYHLNSEEMGAAQSFVANHPEAVGAVMGRAGQFTLKHVYFGAYGISDSRLDALLGTATGVFQGRTLVGIKDTFNFDFKDRGFDPYGLTTYLGVGLMRLDAAGCNGDTHIPVSGGVIP